MKKNVNSQVLDLWHAYQNVKFKKLSNFRQENHPFYILTACNPRSRPLSAISNNLRTQKLRRYLVKQSIEFGEFLCGDPDFCWQELSFAIPVPESRVVNLALLYQQNAIYFVRRGRLILLPVLLKKVKPVDMGLFEKYCIAAEFTPKS